MEKSQDIILANLKINWSVFAEDECRIIEKGIKSGAYEHLSAMINSVTPEKADEIAKIQAQLRPRAFQFKSRVQAEFEQWMSKNPGAMTPEIEADWQRKMDEEREQALARLSGDNPVEVKTTDTGTKVLTSNALTAIHGVAEGSVKKLNAAGIFSIEELSKRTHEERRAIVGPLVAATIKKYFETQTI